MVSHGFTTVCHGFLPSDNFTSYSRDKKLLDHFFEGIEEANFSENRKINLDSRLVGGMRSHIPSLDEVKRNVKSYFALKSTSNVVPRRPHFGIAIEIIFVFVKMAVRSEKVVSGLVSTFDEILSC